MEKKELKFYEAPELEVLKMEIEGALLDASIAEDGGVSGPGEVPDPSDMEQW